MTVVDYSWVTYCSDNPPFGRWDQNHLARLLGGDDWLVPGIQYREVTWSPGSSHGQILVFPAGHYAEHGCLRRVVPKFKWALEQMDWAVVILTSDEQSTFPIEWFADLVHVYWWVQLPDPTERHRYPRGRTFFFGEGSPTPGRDMPHAPNWEKSIDAFFAGQINHIRRQEMADSIPSWGGVVEFRPTAGFLQGMSPVDYYEKMTAARFVPCPSGVRSQSSFRFYEALEAQAIPIPDDLNPEMESGYWDLVHPEMPFYPVRSWAELQFQETNPVTSARSLAAASAWWQGEKRRWAYRLRRSVASAHGDLDDYDPDAVTVLIPTSPSPLHPSIDMIQETICSVRERLPHAEIFVMIDGVRPEQQHREADYWEYARRLCAWTNTQQNILPIVFADHHHQAAMTAETLNRVVTPWILFVEHDTPLTGDIPFADILSTMRQFNLNLMRFHHETHVLDDHAHLYPETEPQLLAPAPFVRTMQWSQRPHLASTEAYRRWIQENFGPGARTMIEDVMHGVVDADWRLRKEKAWEEWRLALYAPSGSGGFKRSLHTDGRRDDPKYPMTFDYGDNDPPPGAPHVGTR